VKVAAVQHDVVWQDREANFAHLSPLIAGAAGAGARLVVLTEMFSTGFGMDTDQRAESFDGPTSQFLQKQAEALDVWVCGSIAEGPPSGDGLPRNTLVLAGPTGEVHRYDKIHPFSYSGEHERYGAGDRFVTVEVEGTRLSLFVCYDLRFANEFWAVAADTDCYVVVANWPEARRHHWRSLLVARAIENQAYVVGVNRVGDGGGLSYVGDSAIIDPLGETLAYGAKTEALLVAEVDPALVVATRQRFPFLADRRETPARS
jgi:predicted amidohydrolase